jgi:Ca2+-binding EF-hand superfamily protein
VFTTIIQIGDADGDGSIDVNDVTSTINYILGKPVASFFQGAADVDGDGTIDVNDVQGIIDRALGK